MNTLEVVIHDFISVCDKFVGQIKKNLRRLKKKLSDFIKETVESYRKIFRDKKILARPPTAINALDITKPPFPTEE